MEVKIPTRFLGRHSSECGHLNKIQRKVRSPTPKTKQKSCVLGGRQFPTTTFIYPKFQPLSTALFQAPPLTQIAQKVQGENTTISSPPMPVQAILVLEFSTSNFRRQSKIQMTASVQLYIDNLKPDTSNYH